MRFQVAMFGLVVAAMGLAPIADPLHAPLAAQDADDDDDDDDGSDDDDDDVEDPDDGGDDAGGDDAGGDDAGGDDAGGDDAGGDDAGGDDAGGDDAGGDDAGGDDDGAGGDDDGTGGGDDGGAGGDDDGGTGGDDDGGAGGDDDGGAGGNDDDDGGAGGDDDGGNDDITDDRGDLDDADDAVDQDPVNWEIIVGDTESDRAELDEREGIGADGDGFRYRRSEFIALDERLKSLEGTLVLLRGPSQLTDEAALDALDAVADPDTVGYNHLFDSSAVQTARRRTATVPERIACGCEIGLIDTGVAGTLGAFKHATLTQRAFNGKQPLPKLHGTAVAYLMAGTKASPARPTKVFVADIFSGPRETSGSSFALIKALDWLAAQGVPVINVSLSGPRNPAVANAIARITKRGIIVVAAAGNDGPAAPPVFPGAYEGVVGVTAVDAQNRVYRYANRGAYVDFSARGVAVPALDAQGAVRDATGTSFAAPVIAARLAAQLKKPDPAAAAKAIAALEKQARDLGPRGRDPIYGAGLIGEPQ